MKKLYLSLYAFHENFLTEDDVYRFLDSNLICEIYLCYYADNLDNLAEWLMETENEFSEQLESEVLNLNSEIKSFITYQNSVINRFNFRLQALQEKINSERIDLDELELSPIWQVHIIPKD
jgi:hypothetical protein